MAYDGYALKEGTHQAINENIAKRSIDDFTLSTYVQKQLGLLDGEEQQIIGLDADQKFVSGAIYVWLGYGGEQEDKPGSYYDFARNNPTRSVNHFHNPLQPWGQAGLNDPYPFNDLHNTYRGESSVVWAQDPIQRWWGTTDNIGGHWSWSDARNYFYTALTGKGFAGTDFADVVIAPTWLDKDRYLADTFRAVGQLMHLVQDSSVPEHVRNSLHILPAYESQVEAFRSKNGTFWKELIANPITFDKSILDISIPPDSLASVPIARIVDTDKYVGSNPGLTATLGIFDETIVPPQITIAPQTIGLAEYTNANFMNKATMFESDAQHNFPYPRTIDTVEWTDSNKKKYFKKVGSGDVVNHLAVTGLKYSYRKRYFPQDQKYLPVTLDEECYKDYAQHLIPRAVGYSAGLLKYFFRGKLEIALPAEQIYAVIDGSQTPQQFSRIKAKVTNTTKDEEMKDGNLVVVAEYKVIPDYQTDLSTYPPTAAVMDNVSFSYSVSAPSAVTAPLAAKAARDFTFNFPDQPIPAGITDLSMYVVFKGTLGNEKDTAIAVAWQPLFEPVHQTFWNATDRFSLNNVLKTELEINSDPVLQANVDLYPSGNPNGITSELPYEPYIKPYPMRFEIGYAGKNPPEQPVATVATADVQAGGYIKLIALVSEETNYVKVKSTNESLGTTEFVDPFYGTVCNGYGDSFTCEPKKTFRNVRQDYKNALLRCYPMDTDASGRHFCAYNETGVDFTNFGPLAAGITFGN